MSSLMAHRTCMALDMSQLRRHLSNPLDIVNRFAKLVTIYGSRISYIT